jgi:hypothetical protein
MAPREDRNTVISCCVRPALPGLAALVLWRPFGMGRGLSLIHRVPEPG